MRKKFVGLNDDDWWLDYLEKQVDMERDVALALACNKSLQSGKVNKDRDIFLRQTLGEQSALKNLLEVRTLVKESDEVVLPEDLRIYDSLHDRIMAEINPAEPAMGGILESRGYQIES